MSFLNNSALLIVDNISNEDLLTILESQDRGYCSPLDSIAEHNVIFPGGVPLFIKIVDRLKDDNRFADLIRRKNASGHSAFGRINALTLSSLQESENTEEHAVLLQELKDKINSLEKQHLLRNSGRCHIL